MDGVESGVDKGSRIESEGVAPSLRAVMSRFPTGVTIVAAHDADGSPIGLTVNSFTSVSLDPPLVLVCINRRANSHDPLLAGGGFTVSILSGAQADVATRFAQSPSEGRFEGVEWSPAPSGKPVVAGCAAWLDCSIHSVVEAGDHTVILGHAEAADWTDQPALLFHRGVLGPVGE